MLSPSRNNKRQHSQQSIPGDDERQRFPNFPASECLQKKENTKGVRNFSYWDHGDQSTKITQRLIIPSDLAAHLSRRDIAYNIQQIEKKYKVGILIHSESNPNVFTAQGIEGRIVTLMGEPKMCSKAFYYFNRELIDLENQLNGHRRI